MTLYGHAQVPSNFEVPRDASWPEISWDVKLGRSLLNIVSKVKHSTAFIVGDSGWYLWLQSLVKYEARTREMNRRVHGGCSGLQA